MNNLNSDLSIYIFANNNRKKCPTKVICINKKQRKRDNINVLKRVINRIKMWGLTKAASFCCLFFVSLQKSCTISAALT